MKTMKIAALALVITLAGTAAFASDLAVSASDTQVSSSFSGSYRVAVTDDIADFLRAEGIDLSRSPTDKDLWRSIDALRQVVVDEETGYTKLDQLNAMVNKALFAAYNSGYEPVYMTIGGLRWAAGSDVSM